MPILPILCVCEKPEQKTIVPFPGSVYSTQHNIETHHFPVRDPVLVPCSVTEPLVSVDDWGSTRNMDKNRPDGALRYFRVPHNILQSLTHSAPSPSIKTLRIIKGATRMKATVLVNHGMNNVECFCKNIRQKNSFGEVTAIIHSTF